MIRPILQDDALLKEIKAVATDENNLYIWWLGQSGYLLFFQGEYLLLDPYLSDSLTKKYADTNKPHVRMSERVIAPEKLDFIYTVTSSHNHTDHLDGKTLLPLIEANPDITVVVSEANREFAADRLAVSSDRLTGIKLDKPVSSGKYELHAIPAAHEDIELSPEGDHHFIGLIIKAGSWVIYHSGDTVLYDDMLDYLKPWKIDVALLPINGRDPARGVAGNLSGSEAIELAKQINAGIVIPCHYDMFEFNTVSPNEFIEHAEELQQAYRVLEIGEGWSTGELIKARPS